MFCGWVVGDLFVGYLKKKRISIFSHINNLACDTPSKSNICICHVYKPIRLTVYDIRTYLSGILKNNVYFTKCVCIKIIYVSSSDFLSVYLPIYLNNCMSEYFTKEQNFAWNGLSMKCKVLCHVTMENDFNQFHTPVHYQC